MNYYGKAIDILMEIRNRNLDALAILKEIAKSNPAILIKASESKISKNIEKEIIPLLKENSVIPAIKKYRELAGVGLKEAKEFIDELKQKYSLT